MMVHDHIQGVSRGSLQHPANGGLLQACSRGTCHLQQRVAACSPQPSLYCFGLKPCLFSCCLAQSERGSMRMAFAPLVHASVAMLAYSSACNDFVYSQWGSCTCAG